MCLGGVHSWKVIVIQLLQSHNLTLDDVIPLCIYQCPTPTPPSTWGMVRGNVGLSHTICALWVGHYG